MSNHPMNAMRSFARLRTALATALLLPACLHAGAAEAAAPGIAIVHSNAQGYAIDANAYPVGPYLAVTCDRGACTLVPAQVTITSRSVDGDDGPASMSVLHADLRTHTLFLVQGVPGLAAGPLKTWYVNERFLAADDPASMQPARRRLDRAVASDNGTVSFAGHWLAMQEPGCEGIACATREIAWKVRFGETERTLATVSPDGIVGEDGLLGVDDVLVWMGEHVGDGKPDCVIRPQAPPDSLELSLFLSSQLQVGKPWRAAAKFYWWDPSNPGC